VPAEVTAGPSLIVTDIVEQITNEIVAEQLEQDEDKDHFIIELDNEFNINIKYLFEHLCNMSQFYVFKGF
jgi:hypothetical protein